MMKLFLFSFWLLISFPAVSQDTKYPDGNTNTIIISFPENSQSEALKEFADYLHLKGFYIEDYDNDLYFFSTKPFTKQLGNGLNTRGYYTAYIYVFCNKSDDNSKLYVSGIASSSLSAFGENYISSKMKNTDSQKTFEGNLFEIVHKLILQYANNSEKLDYHDQVTYTEL